MVFGYISRNLAMENKKYSSSATKMDKRKMMPIRTIPMPVILSNSWDIAEKYDDYLRMLCKEHPSTMKNLRFEKRSIQGKKNILNSLIQKIKLDVQDMQSAALQLDELYKKEQEFTSEKEEEISALNARLQAARERKDVLLAFIDKFMVTKTFLDSLAKSNKFPDVMNLVRSYLILEALNEQFVQHELQCMLKMKNIQDIHLETEMLQKEHLSSTRELEKRYENIASQLQNAKQANSELQQVLDNSVVSQKEEHASWEQIKRWSSGVCKKILVYKDVTSHSKDFMKQLDEIYDFIEHSRKILKK